MDQTQNNQTDPQGVQNQVVQPPQQPIVPDFPKPADNVAVQAAASAVTPEPVAAVTFPPQEATTPTMPTTLPITPQEQTPVAPPQTTPQPPQPAQPVSSIPSTSSVIPPPQTDVPAMQVPPAPVPPPAQNAGVVPPPQTPVNVPSSPNTTDKILMSIIGFLVVGVVASSGYLVTLNNQTTSINAAPVRPQNTVLRPTATPSPTPTIDPTLSTDSELEKEAAQVQVEDGMQETSLETDLNGL